MDKEQVKKENRIWFLKQAGKAFGLMGILFAVMFLASLAASFIT